MKSPFLYSTLALALFAVACGAQADNTKPAEKSKQAMDNVINAGAVKGSTTTISGNNSLKAKPDDSAADFRPKQKPLKIVEPASPKEYERRISDQSLESACPPRAPGKAKSAWILAISESPVASSIGYIGL